MKIICGLGNPGAQYENTRHNTGFLFLDYLTEKYQLPPFALDKKFNALTVEGFLPHSKEKIILLKPQTFMNRSGATVLAILQFYKVPPSDLIVVHDDLDITIGKFKVSHDTRAAGHNGVQNIITGIGTQNFTRIRVGIEAEGGKKARGQISGEAYVLQNFLPTEQNVLIDVFERMITDVLCNM